MKKQEPQLPGTCSTEGNYSEGQTEVTSTIWRPQCNGCQPTSGTDPNLDDCALTPPIAMNQLLCFVNHISAYYDSPNWNIMMSTSITVHVHLEYDDHFIGVSKQEPNHHIISDSSRDTYIIGCYGWKELACDLLQMANLVTFDPSKMHKAHCPIVTAAT